ncbi:high-affinity methionine permease [Colletotrichum somersetense]|nr:high-affinity methionine permease [Colletotrichum somersetense]
MLCNIVYFAAVPKADFRTAKEIAAAVFFTKVFGTGPADQALNFVVLLSAFGNLLATLIGASRVIREIGRQGVLPWPRFWVNTKPFGTPIGPYFLKLAMTFIMIVAPPAGDAFQFVVSLKTYPDGVFHFAMAVGVYLSRTRRKRANLGGTEFKSCHVTVIFFILIQVYILLMPWWPPEGGPYAGSVSFYLIVCFVYYAVWMWLLPKWKGYRIRPEILEVSDNGANTHRLVQVPLSELAQWDNEHDDAGNLRRRHVDSECTS